MKDVCGYEPNDPLYLSSDILKGDPYLAQRVRRDKLERERLEIERRRNEITLKSIDRTVKGAIIAATIGAIALIFTNIYINLSNKHESAKVDKLITSMVNFKMMQNDLHYLAQSARESDVRYRTNDAMLRSLHKKFIPEEYPDAFGRIKFNDTKSSK